MGKARRLLKSPDEFFLGSFHIRSNMKKTDLLCINNWKKVTFQAIDISHNRDNLKQIEIEKANNQMKEYFRMILEIV